MEHDTVPIGLLILDVLFKFGNAEDIDSNCLNLT